MNRRQFVKAAAYAATASISSRQSNAQDSIKAIRCALLGINHAHALDLLQMVQRSEVYAVAGVCEPDGAVRKQFEKHPAMKGVPWLSKEEVLRDKSIEMVAIESDVSRLLPLAREAVNAGKHIHLDKPAGTSLPEFKALLEAAEAQQLLVQMGYMYRYNPGFDLIRQALKEGWLGEVYSIHASMCTALNAEKRKRIALHPGGVMLELGCHLIDMIVLLLGEPKKVTPFLRHDGPFDDTLADNTLAILEYDRAMVTVETAAMEPGAFAKRRFKVAGTGGTMILEPLEPPRLYTNFKKTDTECKSGPQQRDLPELHRHLRDVEGFAQCIRGKAQFSYSKQHDYTVQRTVLRASGMSV